MDDQAMPMGDEEMVKCACGTMVKKSEWDAHAAMGAEHVPAPADEMPADETPAA